ncbi:hypothetical protein ACFFUT_10940 [Pseudohalocynthiibacter aestuariivivens]|jgi:hypothetical protein|uniref:Apolipoprotein acyltransferase n=1 Tax=Pseudohalocynthiibacter aestuariivivens TaxID=1591409 RepID=A0ABV5JG16_9RHOB|nr:MULTISPECIES: hypothetical protein [Pseudohalocynthiibacter]MBS9716370.1 hypothetical protein [Pseudohalocynthiibacter aestuariivivens]MCK0100821.1 hypothetical protein [Pseudohalocynthiibacter sp. F2068]
MLVIGGLIIGAIFGVVLAGRRQGNRLDKVQYAAVFALIFAIIGLFATIAVERML